MQEQIYQILTQKDEITWKSLIYDLVRSEQMDPWNIDISLLANKYLKVVKEIQEANLFVSGKVILASAILLKMKSEKLVNEDLKNFDDLLYNREEEEIMDEEDNYYVEDKDEFVPQLTIKSPQKRKRKVSMEDLMNALDKALKVNKRKILRKLEEKNYHNMKIPEKKIDISKLIQDLYLRIKEFFKVKRKLTFTELVASDKKEDKILTFIPLLHLANKEKINLEQEKHFGEISILER